MAQGEGELLHRVGREVILVVEDIVMGGPGGAQKTGVGLEVEVEFGGRGNLYRKKRKSCQSNRIGG